MTLIAHLADLHLGYSHLNRATAAGQNQREADFERAALAVIEHIVTVVKPDVVVFAGDTLHDTRVSNAALNGAVECFERLRSAGIPAVVIGGNHDEAGAPGRFNALHLLERHGAQLYLHQDELDIAGVRLHLMPFQTLSRALRGLGEVRPFAFSDERPNVLVAHGYVASPGMPTPPEEIALPDDWCADPRFDLALLGHVHRHFKVQGFPNAYYAGSLERRNFGEEQETPGFWVHELDQDGTLRSRTVTVASLGVDLTPRPMVKLDIAAHELTTDELSATVLEHVSSTGAHGAMMCLVLQGVSAELDRSRAQSGWLRAFKAAGGFYLDTPTHTRRVTELLDVQFAAPPVNIAQAFEEFLAAQAYPDEQSRERMLALGAEVMTVAHDKLLSQETD